MIGCDGAHSVVRHGLGMEFEGDTMPSHFILADVHLAGGPPLDEIKTYWHEAGAAGDLSDQPRALSGRRRRGRAESRRAYAATRRWRRCRRSSISAAPAASRLPIRSGSRGFTINERKVADYRAGRRVPRRRRGACPQPRRRAGHEHRACRTRFNLAWKLALVCRGVASPEPLLGSYSAERSEVGREVLANAGRLTTIATDERRRRAEHSQPSRVGFSSASRQSCGR